MNRHSESQLDWRCFFFLKLSDLEHPEKVSETAQCSTSNILYMEINEIIKSGNNVMLVVSSNDLLRFADTIVQRALENHANEETQQRKEDEDEEKFLTRKEVKSIFDVCDSTLWSWHKHGLLCHRKFGRKCVYALSDIRRFMNDHVEKDTAAGYVKWHEVKANIPE